MDKVFSARLDTAVVNQINGLARQLHSTKKQVIERAISLFAIQVEREKNGDVFQESFGAWNRKESAETTVEKSRATFRKSMERFER